jgi:hypothetical protein
MQIHNLISDLFKFLSMQWLCHIIPNHVVSWTDFNLNITFFLILKWQDLLLELFLPSFSIIIALLLSCRIIPLVSPYPCASKNLLLHNTDPITSSTPTNSAAIELLALFFLFTTNGYDCSTSHCHYSSCMTLKVRMDSKGCINVSF